MFALRLHLPVQRVEQRVAQVEVEVIISLAITRSVLPDPRAGKHAPRHCRILLDVRAVIQILIPDPVYVRCRAPAVTRGMTREPVSGRAVSAVRRNVYVRADLEPE